MNQFEAAFAKAFKKEPGIYDVLKKNQDIARERKIKARLEARILAEKERLLNSTRN